MTERVTHYHASVHHTSTGSTTTGTFKFSQVQADEIGAVLHEDGINIVSAQRLLEKWNRRGGQGSIGYRYWLE